MKQKIKIFVAILITSAAFFVFNASATDLAEIKTNISQNLYFAIKTSIKGTVFVKGDPYPGSVLTADTSFITPKYADLKYQWYRGTEEIYGGYFETYIPTEDDIGQRIWVIVSGTKNFTGEIISSPVVIEEKPEEITPPEEDKKESNTDVSNTDNNENQEEAVEEKKPFERVNEYTEGIFTDIDENSWYGLKNQKSVKEAYEFGIMTGTTDTTFEPEGKMTVAQAITIAARIHNSSLGGKHKFSQTVVWYKAYVTYAIKNNIITAKDFSEEDFERPATRAEAAYIFSKALAEPNFEEINSVSVLPDVNENTPYSESIFTLYKAGILIGNDPTGIFYPDQTITRAQAATIITRLIISENRVEIEFTPS